MLIERSVGDGGTVADLGDRHLAVPLLRYQRAGCPDQSLTLAADDELPWQPVATTREPAQRRWPRARLGRHRVRRQITYDKLGKLTTGMQLLEHPARQRATEVDDRVVAVAVLSNDLRQLPTAFTGELDLDRMALSVDLEDRVGDVIVEVAVAENLAFANPAPLRHTLR